MTKSLSASVDITLDGETYQLVPSLKAATAVSRQFDGFLGAYQALGNLNLDAYVQICRAGINRNIISSDDLGEAIYRTGVSKMAAPLSRFVSVLQNGGRDPDEADADETDDSNEGDGGNGGN